MPSQVVSSGPPQQIRDWLSRAIDIISFFDANGKTIWETPAACSVLGFAPGSTEGLTLREQVHSADIDIVQEDLRQLLADPSSIVRNRRIRARCGDNSYRWLEYTARNRLRDADIAAIVVTWSDVTADVVEHESRNRHYQAMFEESVVGMFQATPEGTYRTMNRALAEMYGFSSPEEAMASLTDIANQLYVHPERRREFIELLASHGQLSEFEFEIRRKDGVERWLSASAREVRDPSGNIYYEGTIRDIDARKRAEIASAESNAILNGIMEQMPDCLFLLDTSDPSCPGKIVAVNEAACAMHQWSRRELLGRSITFLDDRETAAEAPERLRAMASGETLFFRGVHKRRDGTTFPVEVVAREIRIGNRVLVLALDRDITERIVLEEKLAQAQKMEAIGRVAGGVAHDFNNMLTVILGNAELLASDPSLSVEASELIQQIHFVANRSADLTRQLLTFGRRQPRMPRPLCLNPIIVEMSRILSRVIGERITIQLDLASDLDWVLMDRGQVDQVLMNLVVNARDAMPNGGTLRIATGNVEEVAAGPTIQTGKHVLLAVSDSGHGIEPEVLPKIFEPFFSTKDANKGTGLGLATVYGIVTQNHGAIDVESERGVGTTFRIYLPITYQRDHSGNPPHVPQGGKKACVLIVEDDPGIRCLAERILTQAGHVVYSTEDSDHALELVGKLDREIDLVLCDVVLPGMSGPVLYKQLTSMVPNLKGIFMSGFPQGSGPDIEGDDAGSAFLEKPFHPQDLLTKVRLSLE